MHDEDHNPQRAASDVTSESATPQRFPVLMVVAIVLGVVVVLSVLLVDVRSTNRTQRPQPKVQIISPKNGAVVSPDVEFLIKASNFDTGRSLKKTPGVSPIYFFQMDEGKFDSREFTEESAVAARGVRELKLPPYVYSASFQPQVTYRRLPPGKHTLVAKLMRPDGSLVKGVQDTVTVTVQAPKIATANRRPTNARGEGIILPALGATVGPMVQIQLSFPKNFAPNPTDPGYRATGIPRRYVKWQLDGGTFDIPAFSSAMGYPQVKNASISVTSSVVYRDLPPGRHVIEVELVDQAAPSLRTRFSSEFIVTEP